MEDVPFAPLDFKIKNFLFSYNFKKTILDKDETLQLYANEN